MRKRGLQKKAWCVDNNMITVRWKEGQRREKKKENLSTI